MLQIFSKGDPNSVMYTSPASSAVTSHAHAHRSDIPQYWDDSGARSLITYDQRSDNLLLRDECDPTWGGYPFHSANSAHLDDAGGFATWIGYDNATGEVSGFFVFTTVAQNTTSKRWTNVGGTYLMGVYLRPPSTFCPCMMFSFSSPSLLCLCDRSLCLDYSCKANPSSICTGVEYCDSYYDVCYECAYTVNLARTTCTDLTKVSPTPSPTPTPTPSPTYEFCCRVLHDRMLSDSSIDHHQHLLQRSPRRRLPPHRRPPLLRPHRRRHLRLHLHLRLRLRRILPRRVLLRRVSPPPAAHPPRLRLQSVPFHCHPNKCSAHCADVFCRWLLSWHATVCSDRVLRSLAWPGARRLSLHGRSLCSLSLWSESR